MRNKKTKLSILILGMLMSNLLLANEIKENEVEGLYTININKEFIILANIKMDNNKIYLPIRYIKKEMYEKYDLSNYIIKKNEEEVLVINKNSIVVKDDDEMSMLLILNEEYFNKDKIQVKKINHVEKTIDGIDKENIRNYFNNNYQLSLDKFKKISGYLETKYSNKDYWSIQNKMIEKDSKMVRLSTVYKKDFADKSALEFGDIKEDGLGTLSRLNGLGVKYSTNYFNNYNNSNILDVLPQYSVNGFSVTPSMFNMYTNSNALINNEISSGNYNVIMPYNAGYGIYSGFVKDYLGNIQEFKLPYYNSNKLIQKDGLEYSVSLASVRKNQYTKSFDYEKPFLSGIMKYGVSKNITQDFGISYSSYFKNIYTATNFYVDPKYGFFQVGANYNGNNEVLYNVGWELISKDPWNFKVNSSFANKGKSFCINYLNECIKEQSRYSISYKLFENLGTLSYQYLTEKKLASNYDSHNFVWSKSINNNLNLSVVYEQGHSYNNNILTNDNKKFLVLMSYNFNDKLSGSVNYQNNSNNSSIQTRLNFGEDKDHPEYGYGNISLVNNSGSNYKSENYSKGGFYYGANLKNFSYSIDNKDINKLENSRVDMRGSFTYIEGENHLSFNKNINGLILVDTDNEDEIEIYHQNKLSGKTNKDGKLIITNGTAYNNEKVEINIKALDIDKNYELFEKEIKVPEYGALKVKFNKIKSDYTIVVKNLKEGTILTNENEKYIVGKNGELTINKEGLFKADNGCSFNVELGNKEYNCK